MKNHLLGLAFAVAVAAAPAAHAATFVNLPPAAADGSITAAFGQTGVGAGIFEHTFNFTFPSAGLASTGVTSIRVGGPKTNIDFTSVTLNGVAFNIVNGVFDLATLENQPVLAGLQTLYVSGVSGGNGSYSVDLAFNPTAVPEPGAWALMIVGFGGVGAVVRTRRKAGLATA